MDLKKSVWVFFELKDGFYVVCYCFFTIDKGQHLFPEKRITSLTLFLSVVLLPFQHSS